MIPRMGPPKRIRVCSRTSEPATGKVRDQDASRGLRLMLLVCLAKVFGLSSMGVFPALLPTFRHEWGLSHTEAGWISAA